MSEDAQCKVSCRPSPSTLGHIRSYHTGTPGPRDFFIQIQGWWSSPFFYRRGSTWFHVGFCLIIYLRDFCCHYLDFWSLHIVCSRVHLPCSYVQFSVSGRLLGVSPFHLMAASCSDAGISLPGVHLADLLSMAQEVVCWRSWCCSDGLSCPHVPQYLGVLFVFPHLDLLGLPLPHWSTVGSAGLSAWHHIHLCILVRIYL